MAQTSALLDLPVELLLTVFSCLDLESFLNLSSTCKALHDPDLVYDASYWSSLLRSTFRVPNQPAVEQDGERWFKLFKRMHTQTRIYTWGNNEKSCLGHSYMNIRPGLSWRQVLPNRHVSWPEKMLRTDELGVISDLQCGGWSTTLLTAKGALYTVGIIDDLLPVAQDAKHEPLPLRYPPGFPHPYDRYDASTAIKQFSSGRAHILGLTDSGRIWSWQNIERGALHVKFIQHGTVENGRASGQGVVRKVVAGWNKSAALIEGTGIVLWEPLRREPDETEIEDTALVLESVVVPKTGYVDAISRSDSRHQRGGNPGTELVGEVRNFIVLERVVIFNTHLGKVFVAQIFWNNRGQMISKPLELELPADESEEAAFATDVQGSFQSFAVFTRSGAVLTSKQDHVLKLLNREQNDQSLFTLIPALQKKNVIQLAFGDYHFHALHADGYITSYGTEPQRCGALGLGGHGGPDSRLRGIRPAGRATDDVRLIPHAYAEGRRVWFDREKRAWIDFLTSGGVDPAEAQERVRMALGVPDMQCQGEVSEWVEQQGRDWEEKFGVKDEDEDGLGTYFALSVTAAGWHSGALVLENRELVEKLRRACEVGDPTIQPFRGLRDGDGLSADVGNTSLLGMAIATGSDWGRWAFGMAPYDAQSIARSSQDEPGNTPNTALLKRGVHAINFGAAPRVGYLYRWANDHFPRLRLRDGTEMPGNVPFDEWRYERPDWDVDFAL